MIVRKEPNGELLLLTQTDHSRLAGQFAAHWGNADFAPLTPYESVVRAATFHDFGYLRYETAPSFDPETGGTPMFRQIATDARRLEEYQWCFEWLLGLDPYASLMVSMHRTGLWRQRYRTIASAIHNVKGADPLIDAFIERHEALRPELIARHGIDAKQLWTNYRLLQVWDLLSLHFSCTAPFDDVIEPVPTSYATAGDDGVRMTLTPVDATTVAIDPYPFDTEALVVTVPAKRLSQAQFENQDAFRAAYFRAPVELLRFTLLRSKTAALTGDAGLRQPVAVS
jgi:hypothetical protein